MTPTPEEAKAEEIMEHFQDRRLLVKRGFRLRAEDEAYLKSMIVAALRENGREKISVASEALTEIIKAHKGLEVSPKNNNIPAHIRLNGAIEKCKTALKSLKESKT